MADFFYIDLLLQLKFSVFPTQTTSEAQYLAERFYLNSMCPESQGESTLNCLMTFHLSLVKGSQKPRL